MRNESLQSENPQALERRITFSELGRFSSELINDCEVKLQSDSHQFKKALVKGYFSPTPGAIGGLNGSEIKYEKDGVIISVSHQVRDEKRAEGSWRIRDLQVQREGNGLYEYCAIEEISSLARREDQSTILNVIGGNISYMQDTQKIPKNTREAIEKARSMLHNL